MACDAGSGHVCVCVRARVCMCVHVRVVLAISALSWEERDRAATCGTGGGVLGAQVDGFPRNRPGPGPPEFFRFRSK